MDNELIEKWERFAQTGRIDDYLQYHLQAMKSPGSGWGPQYEKRDDNRTDHQTTGNIGKR